MKVIIFLLALVFAVLVMPAHGYIIDVEPEPEYSYGQFLKPLKVVQLETQNIFEILVILSMLAVNLLKVFGTFFALKMKDPAIKFNPNYLIAAVLGVFVGYMSYMQSDPVIDTTYIGLFMESGFYALGANLLFDFAGKVRGKLS